MALDKCTEATAIFHVLVSAVTFTRSRSLFQIRLDNITLHLVEDRPSRNVTCPGKLPVDIAIPAIVIARDRSGLFCIQPAGDIVVCPLSLAVSHSEFVCLPPPQNL